jgi:asparagine synthase (glutamine-hydrolysing)
MMCGIAGQINFDQNDAVDRNRLVDMADAIGHRGPDHSGLWMDGPVGLAHRRLSIIDLTDDANQPICNEDGSVVLVYNGEIYNFQSLQQDLAGRGHQWRSRTDSEVLVHLYEEYGFGMLDHLRGMFAFAIWDKNRRLLFAARDRAGQKPFKYYHDDRRFVFASELKAILRDPDIRPDVDPEAIHEYMGFGYVPAPKTGFRDIRKLPPAHYLTVKDGAVEVKRYWSLDFRSSTRLSFEDGKRELLARLEESTRMRMMSDVPLGAFLSGGIDSAAIVALMAGSTHAKIRTFSIGFDYENYNELPAARMTARKFDCEHTEHVVKANAAEVLPELVRLYEEPYADSSALPSWCLARMTRQSVTVALNGDGGDELFFGYRRYQHYDRLLSWLIRFKKWHLVRVLGLARFLPGSMFDLIRHRAAVLRSLIPASPGEVYSRVICKMSDSLIMELYTRDFMDHVRDVQVYDLVRPRMDLERAGGDNMTQALLFDFENYLAGDLCPKMDIAGMSHGLEARSPFLDHKLIEFCASLPREWKYSRGRGKYILREALKNILPAEILDRPKKGFGIPVHDWFRGELKELCHDTLLAPKSRIHQYVRQDTLRNMVKNHMDGTRQEGARLWLLLTLELWLREFHDQAHAR